MHHVLKHAASKNNNLRVRVMTSTAILSAPRTERRRLPHSFWLAILLCACTLLSACSNGDDAQAPAGLSYAMTSAVYEAGEPIVPNRPSVSGGAVERYTVAPPLPDGLALDGTTGVIAGTPRSVSAPTLYVVTATNGGGSATARVQIEVRDTPAAPAGLAYREPAVTYTVGAPIAANTPTSSGGPIAAYRIAPALPAGLAFDTQTGAITGTPTAVSAATSHTVTGSNAAGETTATVQITVQAAAVAPASLSYSSPVALYVRGEAIVPNTAVLSGGTAATFSVSPALPPGLSLNTETGVIAGTPTTVQSQATYTLTASNGAGSVQAQVRIAVTSRGSWTTVAPMLVPRSDGVVANLPGGRVLAAGGRTSGGVTDLGEIYDPLANSWTATGFLTTAREEATSTVLADGRVLMVGGSTAPGTALASAEIYDPATGTWYPAASMLQARVGHSATLLPDGRVLVLGGFSGGAASALNTAEVYNPLANSWTSLATTLAVPRGQHAATLLPGGNTVLLAGGLNSLGHASSAELYPVSGSGPTTSLAYPGASISVTRSVLLGNGKVLVMGDGNATTWVYDPAASTWTPSTMQSDRSQPAMIALPDGRVLAAGGAAAGGVRLATTEIYQPDTNLWTAGAPMSVGRQSAGAALLGDGSVLVMGGHDGSADLYQAETFRP